ncbi:MAG: hypothetical protein K6A80_10480 [Saccharofermentans sp.]|nr:hypothetical protein [Saccharofermentans sp.]
MNEYALGNPDADTLFFASNEVVIECDPLESAYDLFKCEDELCLILKSPSGYSAIIIDSDTLEKTDRIDFDIPSYTLVSFCYAGSNRIACSKSSNGYILVDLEDGSLVADKTYRDSGTAFSSVSSAEAGFVYASDSVIIYVSADGTEQKRVSMNDVSGEIPRRNAFFTVNGKNYIVISDGLNISYYEIDFINGVISEMPVATQNDLQLSEDSLFGNGRFAYDQFENVIYEIDPFSKTKSPCAYIDNMMISPEKGMLKNSHLYLIDNCYYVNLRQYYGSVIGIQNIYLDNSLNLNERERIVVKGDNATFDKSLVSAAYQFNTSQNEYWVVVQNYGEEYGYETIDEANMRNLHLIQDFQNGEAPDIFYGNSFDYNYLGEQGIVIDLREYIESGQIIDQTALSGNIYDLLFYKGHCYQLFNGYSMFGLFGDDNLIGQCSNYYAYEEPLFAEHLRGRYISADIVNFIIGYPIRSISDDEDLLSANEIERILNIAITEGISPDEQYNGQVYNDNQYTILTDIGSYAQYSMLSLSRRQPLRFYGFPTIDDCSYMANPKCLVAVSSSSDNKDACISFLKMLFTEESQKANLYNNSLPVVESVLEGYLYYLQNPETIPPDDLSMASLFNSYSLDSGFDSMSSQVYSNFEDSIRSVNGLLVLDWGLYKIIFDEVNSYYYQDRDIPIIVNSLTSRISLYLNENNLVPN